MDTFDATIEKKHERILNFEKLAPRKKQRILNAAYACFARRGYKDSPVADIAAQAGISKAAMFHYFGTKRVMWLYLYRLAVNTFEGNLLAPLEASGRDLFTRLWREQELRLEMCGSYPAMLDFLARAAKEKVPGVPESILKKNAVELHIRYTALMQDVDTACFKPKINVEDAVCIVEWVSAGYAKKAAGRLPTLEAGRGILRYFDILKAAFYRQECL